VETSHFNTNKDIDHLINETESLVTQELEGGDRQKVTRFQLLATKPKMLFFRR